MTWIGLVVMIVLLFRLIPVLMLDRVFQYDDFLEYWAAGRLNLQGSNPYSADLMSALQQSLGRVKPVMMFIPPYALALAMPFGLLPYPLSRMLWFLAGMASIVAAATWLWELAGGSRSRLLLVWIVVLLFSPVLGALHKGQISPFTLLGLAGFLRYERRGQPWMAGSFAALTALKPHWLLLFWLALVLWSFHTRRGKMLLAATSALVAGATLSLFFYGPVLSEYLLIATRDAPLAWHTPTLGGALRVWLGPKLTWVQFAPVLIGVLWLLAYWNKHRGDWRWSERLPAITFASVITAVYGWTYDEVVLLVALVPALQWLFAAANRRAAVALAILGFGLNFAAIASRGVLLDGAYWWLAPAWLAWYVLALSLRRQEMEDVATTTEMGRPA